ncbi:MAG: glycosyltransferase family 2 protein [Blautia sp.]|nr:glycosyltransferase family 2 protein [Blautia sp.]
MEPLLSVVVPVYNVEKYIERCLDSIVAQTYENKQIILIDDGSTDSSGRICDKYAQKYAKIYVHHQKNAGLVEARRTGTAFAEGEYILWVDADDWVEPDYFARMMEAMLAVHVDMVAANLYYDFGEASSVVTNNMKCGIYNVKEIIEGMLYSGTFFEYGIQPHGVTKLYKTEKLKMIQERLDNRICVGEDAAVVYPYICHSERVLLTDICCYHYVQHMGSITKQIDKNEIEKIDFLIAHLKREFSDSKELLRHLDIYRKYLVLRDMTYWDSENVLLYPYGGIERGSRIVIYGAGGLGQSLYAYCREKDIEVAAWLDRNAGHYRSEDLPVETLDEFDETNTEYEYLLIANISEKTALDIKKDLLERGFLAEKIRWFSNEFLYGGT